MNSELRTSRLKKNILFSFLIKGWAGIIQLLLVPITLFCLGNYENGIWMTISSILIWIDSLDIGLGNGLRNTLSAQIANNKIEKARESVSSTFFMLALIIIPICILLILAINFLDVYTLLNIEESKVPNLISVLSLSIAIVSATFIFKFIGNVYLALQLPAVNNLLVVSGQTLTLIGIYMLNILNIHSLMLVALCYTAAPLIVFLIAYPITFGHYYPNLKPNIQYFNKFAIANLFNIGMKFFILQVAGVILFASSNALISYFFTPEKVTLYGIAYRYFSITMLLFTVIAAPFWSATTDAYTRKDFDWIKKSMRKLHFLLISLFIILAFMIIFSDPIYHLWVGKSINISLELSASMALYMFIIICSLCYSYILNGIGALKIQLIFTIGAALAYFPIAYGLSKLLGVCGIVLALSIVNLPGAIANRVQYSKIMNGTAKGFWRK